MLTTSEYRRLEPGLEEVALRADTVLYEPGNPIRHIYFPNDAVASLLFELDGRRTIEVAMEGNEAAVGTAAYFGGARSCNLSVVRDSGTAMRLDVARLRRQAGHRDRLDDLLRRSVHALLVQVAQSAICNRFHSVDARLARWLLMTRDRIDSRDVVATQESISRMLGVRRSSITAAAGSLRRRGTIGYRRGRIVILDPTGLGAAACACYGIIKRQYDSFLR